jgi:hypothetical protein
MAKLSASGRSADRMSEQRSTIHLGETFYAILEKAHRVGYLDDLIQRQGEWLKQNRHDPRYDKRDSIHCSNVYERNVLVGEMEEDAMEFSVIRAELSEQAITEIQQTLGIPIDRHTGDELAAIGRKYWGLNLFQTIEKWSLDHFKRTAGSESIT